MKTRHSLAVETNTHSAGTGGYMLAVLLQFSESINTSAAQVVAGQGGAKALALPSLIATAKPAFAGVRQAVTKLSEAERASLYGELRTMADRNGQSRQVAALTARIVGLLSHPGLGNATDDAILLYLLLWLLDQLVIADFTAMKQPFNFTNPTVDYWYQRTDTAGTHQFNTDGCYLINTIPQIPGPAADYYNAEIYNSTQTDIQPKNVIVNLFPVDDPKTDPAHFWYDLFLNIPYAPSTGLRFEASVKAENLKGGSRGWGFWNTDVFPLSMQIAWFVQFDSNPQAGFYKNGFYAVTQNGITGLKSPVSYQLKDLDEDWHDYRIDVTSTAVEYFVDGQSVYTETDPDVIPTAPMAFHNWVDNAVFGMENNTIIHILQTTTAPRVNRMKNLQLSSLK
jgi:hypothetical protein